MKMPIEVTVRDTETGDTETRTFQNDYCLITDGSCYSSVRTHGNGTHVITVKGRAPDLTAALQNSLTSASQDNDSHSEKDNDATS